MPVSKKPRKKGQRARDLAVRKKFVQGKFKDADDARRTIASLEHQKTRQRRRCEQLGPGLREAHERFILGRHYETVRGWELEDDSLEKAMKTGELPEPEERNDYLEQRGGER